MTDGRQSTGPLGDDETTLGATTVDADCAVPYCTWYCSPVRLLAVLYLQWRRPAQVGNTARPSVNPASRNLVGRVGQLAVLCVVDYSPLSRRESMTNQQ